MACVVGTGGSDVGGACFLPRVCPAPPTRALYITQRLQKDRHIVNILSPNSVLEQVDKESLPVK